MKAALILTLTVALVIGTNYCSALGIGLGVGVGLGHAKVGLHIGEETHTEGLHIHGRSHMTGWPCIWGRRKWRGFRQWRHQTSNSLLHLCQTSNHGSSTTISSRLPKATSPCGRSFSAAVYHPLFQQKFTYLLVKFPPSDWRSQGSCQNMNRALILTSLIVLTGSAFGENPIEVSNDGGLPPLDLKNTGLTTSYCAISGYQCVAPDIDTKQFASTVSQCLSRCNRNNNCVTAFFDKDKICHLRDKRCDKADLNSNAGGMDLFRLQEKESCPTNRPKYVEPNYNFANRFCKAANKACAGRNLYDKPQNISPFDECLKKCAKITSCFGVDYYDGKCEPKEYQCKDAELIATKGTDNYLRLTNDATSCPGNREAPPNNPPVVVTPPTCKNALNKPTTQQSSIVWDGQSDRAVDGNTDGNYVHNTCSHTDIEKEPWWYADFCKPVTLFGVMITNRDTFQNRLTSMDVGLTNHQPPEDFPESDRAVFRLGAFTGTLKLKFKQPRTGRYLVIVLRKEEYLTLCEVDWATSDNELNGFIDGDDVVEVGQSSIAFNGYPERALDGNLDGNYDHQSCTHTLADNDPWWYIQFQSELTIYGVMISNRDSNQYRLTNFEVAVTNTEPPQNYVVADVGAFRATQFTGTLKLKFSTPKTGRFLVIKMRKVETLTLCEVQWVTSAEELTGFIDGDNFFQVKQSSQWSDGAPERAVDGNTDNNFEHNSCTHTNGIDNWWFVEFFNPLTIYGVMITNRDSNEYRIENFEVAVTNNEPPQNYPRSDVGVYRAAMFTGTLKLKFKTAKTGRYLVVKLRTQNDLTLCEVQWVTSAGELTDFIDGDNIDKFILTRQSSQWSDGNPGRAVDGNIDGDYEHHSCSHTNADSPGPWWYADLVNKVTIYGVMISNRDSNQGRLTNFEVAITNIEPPQNYVAADVGAFRATQFTGTLKLKFSTPKTGRFLVIKMRKVEALTLCEVQWVTSAEELTGFVDGDNFLQVKQSSQWSDGAPERAVDGNTDNDFEHHSCTHTDGNNENWWFVEFFNPLTIYGVMITNRDSNEYRIENCEVAVTNNDPPQNYPRSDVGVYRAAMFTGTLKLKFKTAKSGRYLVVKLRTQNVLTLCEVQWVTSAGELTGFIDGDDVDKFIKARQSSQWNDGNPGRAVDGNTDGNYEHHSCSHTNADSPGPWWYADLVNKAEIFGVVITNRDSNQDRLKDFEVAVTNSEPPQNYPRKDVGAYRKEQFTATLKLKFPDSKTGRYLVVHLRYKESLTLCEIQWKTSKADVEIGFVESDTIPAN